jgi:hypothetical protein
MYVLVHHSIRNPNRFWSTAQTTMQAVPPELTLHQTLAAKDGSRATCLWEAASVKAVRDYLEPILEADSSNEYREAENRDGIAVPARLAIVPTPLA